jgi:hypothetical protein
MAGPNHTRITYIGAGVHFAAFLDHSTQHVWKIPKTILFSQGIEPRVLSSVKPFAGIFSYGKQTYPTHNSGPNFKNYIYSAVSQITKIPGYENFFTTTEIFDSSDLILAFQDTTTHKYHDFSIRQSLLTPLSKRVFCRSKINLAKHIYEINSYFWTYGVGFYRYAELLGYENHGLSAEGQLLGFDLTGVTTSLDKMTSRIGPGNQKFQLKVRALSKLGRWHVSNNNSNEFIEFCNEYYSVPRLKKLWRSKI